MHYPYQSAVDPNRWWLSEGHYLVNVHRFGDCFSSPCWIHNPSAHHMRQWPIVYRPDRVQAERTCQHGIGHPDPDQLGDMTHGCDGCCMALGSTANYTPSAQD